MLVLGRYKHRRYSYEERSYRMWHFHNFFKMRLTLLWPHTDIFCEKPIFCMIESKKYK